MLDNAKIDLIGFNPLNDEYTLVMIEKHPWNDIQSRLLEIQDRFNTYLAFAFDGQMEKIHPDSVNNPLRIVLYCPQITNEKVISFINDLEIELRKLNVTFIVKEDY